MIRTHSDAYNFSKRSCAFAWFTPISTLLSIRNCCGAAFTTLSLLFICAGLNAAEPFDSNQMIAQARSFLSKATFDERMLANELILEGLAFRSSNGDCELVFELLSELDSDSAQRELLKILRIASAFPEGAPIRDRAIKLATQPLKVDVCLALSETGHYADPETTVSECLRILATCSQLDQCRIVESLIINASDEKTLRMLVGHWQKISHGNSQDPSSDRIADLIEIIQSEFRFDAKNIPLHRVQRVLKVTPNAVSLLHRIGRAEQRQNVMSQLESLLDSSTERLSWDVVDQVRMAIADSISKIARSPTVKRESLAPILKLIRDNRACEIACPIVFARSVSDLDVDSCRAIAAASNSHAVRLQMLGSAWEHSTVHEQSVIAKVASEVFIDSCNLRDGLQSRWYAIATACQKTWKPSRRLVTCRIDDLVNGWRDRNINDTYDKLSAAVTLARVDAMRDALLFVDEFPVKSVLQRYDSPQGALPVSRSVMVEQIATALVAVKDYERLNLLVGAEQGEVAKRRILSVAGFEIARHGVNQEFSDWIRRIDRGDAAIVCAAFAHASLISDARNRMRNRWIVDSYGRLVTEHDWRE